MYKAECDIVGVTPIVFSKYIDQTQGEAAPKKGENNKSQEYSKRIAHLKAHVDEKGKMYIPACAVADCICTMAKKVGEKVKGNQTWGKVFETGLECEDNVNLGVHIKDSERYEGFFRVSKQQDTRIFKSFPMISKWKGRVKLIIDDNSINPKMIKEYLELAGRRIGLGSFRKQNRGMMGKFMIEHFKTSNMD